MNRWSRSLVVFATLTVSVLYVGLSAGPAAAYTGNGESVCNYSDTLLTQYNSWACEYGKVQYFNESELTVPSGYGIATDGSVAEESLWAFSGPDCAGFTEWASAYAYLYGTTWSLAYADDNALTGISVYTVASASAGDTYFADAVYQGPDDGYGEYWVDIGGYGTYFTGLGFGTCIATDGLFVGTASGNYLNTVYVANGTWTPLAWENSSGDWHDGYNDYYISSPCGSGFSPPYCLNGSYYDNNNEWVSNAPD